jgi:hypothetical protein
LRNQHKKTACLLKIGGILILSSLINLQKIDEKLIIGFWDWGFIQT